ncbi:MAG TPA: ATP-binding protein [Candidatus Elarobacter sp.]|nr:ATP-binding protein [Candidatus Elarobacter sp.]
MMEFAEMPENGERMHQLTRLSRAFTNDRALDDILGMAVEQAATLLGADRAVLMLTDDDGLLRVRAAFGVDAVTVDRFEHPANESLVSRLRGLLGANLADGFVGVPLVTRGNVVGLLATVRPDGSVPTEDDEWVLAALADQVAAPLENARLAKQLASATLLAENVRLFEAERDARIIAEAARREAEVARDAAIQADMSKTAFLAAMSHELRTPLNAISGYVELLEMGLRGPVTPQQADDLGRIRASQGHLLRLITEVLDYARLGAGQTEMSIDDVDLNALLRSAEVMVMPQVQAKSLRYTYEPCPGELIVRADAQRLQQIVLNLLSNAIKFTEPGGAIRIDCEVQRDRRRGNAGTVARVHVHDTGRGIPADRIDAVWQPFVQLGRNLNRPGEGVGLGLAISRDLARRIGGELSAVSEVGKGSTFTLVLPVARLR